MKKKDIFIDKLKDIKLVAHRLGYKMTSYPENSINVLEDIFNKKELLDSCNGFEFDISFTKDNIPVVIHDKYIDDISDSTGLIKKHTLEELKKLKFNFRKSLKETKKDFYYTIVTLEELLEFFQDNLSLLGNKIIKIETKDYIIINKTKMSKLADILNKFPSLSKNIIHLSFWPINLSVLKKIQKKKDYDITKSDLLCDYSIILSLTKIMPFLDNVSLRIRVNEYDSLVNKNNSRRVNKKIKSDYYWMKFSNAISEKNLKYAINKYGSVGLYVLNDYRDIFELRKHISNEFFENNYQKLVITTNNPYYIKTLKDD